MTDQDILLASLIIGLQFFTILGIVLFWTALLGSFLAKLWIKFNEKLF